MDKVDDPVQQFDSETLTPLARLAVGQGDLRLEGWQVQALSGGFEQGSSVQRISGVGEVNGKSTPWSLILKTITRMPGNSASPQASHYWQREPNYYQSGLLADLPGGLRAPRCYGVVERPGCFQLYLEDLKDAFNGPGPDHGWPMETYRTAARCLGEFNGAYLAGVPIPAAEWIPRRWLGAYIEEAAPNMDLFFRSLDHPMLKRSIRGISPTLIRQAWEQRHEILAALDRLPQVFCHQDTFCRNLFAERAAGGERLAAVDWSFAGPGALGCELGALIPASMGLGTIPFAQGGQLAQSALAGYLEGLDSAGWHGNPDLVRFGFSANCFWRYPIGALIGEFTENVINEAYYPIVEQMMGIPVEQVADSTAEWMAWTVPYYEETMRLKKALNL